MTNLGLFEVPIVGLKKLLLLPPVVPRGLDVLRIVRLGHRDRVAGSVLALGHRLRRLERGEVVRVDAGPSSPSNLGSSPPAAAAPWPSSRPPSPRAWPSSPRACSWRPPRQPWRPSWLPSWRPPRGPPRPPLHVGHLGGRLVGHGVRRVTDSGHSWRDACAPWMGVAAMATRGRT